MDLFGLVGLSSLLNKLLVIKMMLEFLMFGCFRKLLFKLVSIYLDLFFR